jgi:hypothetical protein
MHIIISQPRSGSNFIIENVRKFSDISIDKHPYTHLWNKDFIEKKFENKYILVLRKPMDVVVSSLIHSFANKEEPVQINEDALIKSVAKYSRHIPPCSIDEVLKFDFNDLVSQPNRVISKITDLDFSEKELLTIEGLNGSLKMHKDYENVYNFATTHSSIFDEANVLYEEALLKTIKF